MGGALPTSCGTGDCIGLSQVTSTYSRGRDLHGIFFLSWLLIEDLPVNSSLPGGPSWLIT